MTPVERLQTALNGLGLKAVEARLESLLEQASKKEPSYADKAEHNGRPEVMNRLLSADFRKQLKQAEVILGTDEKDGHEFVVFGQSTLASITASGKTRHTLTLRVPILQATDELVSSSPNPTPSAAKRCLVKRALWSDYPNSFHL